MTWKRFKSSSRLYFNLVKIHELVIHLIGKILTISFKAELADTFVNSINLHKIIRVSIGIVLLSVFILCYLVKLET